MAKKIVGDTQTQAQSARVSMFAEYAGSAVLAKSLPASYADYRLMRLHPTISIARSMLVATVASGQWSVECDDGTPDEWVMVVKDSILPMRESIILAAMQSGCVDYGWYPAELLWAYKDELLTLKAIKPLLVDWTDIMVDPASGDFTHFRQTPPMTGSPIYIDADHALLISFRCEGTNWYGSPLLENARRTLANWNDAADAAERYDRKVAGVQWRVQYPPETTEVNGVERDNHEIACELVASLQSGGSVVIPSKIASHVQALNAATPTNAWAVDLIDHNAKQHSFIERLNYLDQLLVRALCMPERTLLQGTEGTKAEAGEHAAGAMPQREIEHRTIVDAVNKQIVNRLLEWNFGPDAIGAVRIAASPLVDSSRGFMQTVYAAMIADPIDGSQVRARIDLDAVMDELGVPATDDVVQPLGDDARATDADAAVASRISRLYGMAASR